MRFHGTLKQSLQLAQMRIRRELLAVLIIIQVLSLAGGCGKGPENGVKYYKHHTVGSILNVHGSPEMVLEVNGRVFRHVYGSSKGYALVPGKASILFVTDGADRDSSQRTIHVYNTNSNDDIQIAAPKIFFGFSIGFGEYIQSVSNNVVVIAQDLDSMTTTWKLDLLSRSIGKEQIIEKETGK